MIEESAIDLRRALSLRERGSVLIDARSPAEYSDATIPGAVNVPLFDDAERARVGTLYKEQGQAAARLLGVDLVAPRIPRMMRAVIEARGASREPVVVFCWRGGMRSRALVSFLNLAGVPALQLRGGHKAFRAAVLDFFERGDWGRLLVLRGLTGVGKTRWLKRLGEEGYPVLDLEGLANHRGSAFGALGLPAQPGQKMFEALLWDRLHRINPGSYVVTEGESRHIGRCILPLRVYQALQEETSLWLNASLDYRVNCILDDYPAVSKHRPAFAASIQGLKPRLGGEAVARLLDLLEGGKWEDLVRELMVLYYDPLYRHSLPERRVEITVEPEEEGLARLRGVIDQVLRGAA